MSPALRPRQGDVWMVDLEPVAGHEQGRRRPCVVVSSDEYNRVMRGMAIVVPLTSRDRGLPHQVKVSSSASGLGNVSFARPEDVRAVSHLRFGRRLGFASELEMADIHGWLSDFLGM
ncbi:type II toxin-antitoxin system PemK/MazF family toxin [Embleya sp. NPDC008237]|uniref:type II toxin-antitoxin system PemK/MazF family toxin n=1 Tax=Embleya sp. NPDC008237 TaxID=3363978 RepID=UPI0036E6233C